jgi:scramblase
MICPKCGFEQGDTSECRRCGIVFGKIHAEEAPSPQSAEASPILASSRPAAPSFVPGNLSNDRFADPRPSGDRLATALASSTDLYLEQELRPIKLVLDWETVVNFRIYDAARNHVGFFLEKAGVASSVLRQARRLPRTFYIVDLTGRVVFQAHRPFYIFFQRLEVQGRSGDSVGTIQSRFGPLGARFSLIDGRGETFASVSGGLLMSKYYLHVQLTNAGGTASIKWLYGGALKALFTDVDNYQVTFGSAPFSTEQRVITFATALLADLRFRDRGQAEFNRDLGSSVAGALGGAVGSVLGASAGTASSSGDDSSGSSGGDDPMSSPSDGLSS